MNIIDRVKNIIITPKTEWDKISGEGGSLSTVLTGYVLPLALMGAAATAIGWGLIGKTYNFGLLGGITVKGFDIGLKYAVVSLISVVAGYIITAYVVDALAPSFGSEKNLNRSGQLVGYGYTPALVGALLGIFPAIAWLGALFGLYGIYLLYLGLGPIKKTPEDKKVVYLLVTFVVLIAVYLILGIILTSVFGLANLGRSGLA